MEYPDFIATCTGAKDCSSPYTVYLQGDQGTLIVSGASSGVCKDVFFDAPKKDQIGKKAVDTKEKSVLNSRITCCMSVKILWISS